MKKYVCLQNKIASINTESNVIFKNFFLDVWTNWFLAANRKTSKRCYFKFSEPMTNALLHRGPGDLGAWVDIESGIALGHRRLAILDLSPTGHQPMQSYSNHFVIAYNGEIYNHLSIRAELASQGLSPVWRGHSDTKTLLTAIQVWGLEATLHKCVGMFAIALWDMVNGTLELERDRLGEKPLYYGWVEGAFLFGSELKSLKAYSGFDAQICREALAQHLRCSYVSAPLSIYKRIFN